MVQMLHLTHISCLCEQVKVFGTGPFPPYYKSYSNQTRMDDASEDADYNAWYGCCILPIFHAWVSRWKIYGQVHYRLTISSTATKLAWMMHLSADYNAWNRCCIWPIFHAWVSRSGKMKQVHFQPILSSRSTKLLFDCASEDAWCNARYGFWN